MRVQRRRRLLGRSRSSGGHIAGDSASGRVDVMPPDDQLALLGGYRQHAHPRTGQHDDLLDEPARTGHELLGRSFACCRRQVALSSRSAAFSLSLALLLTVACCYSVTNVGSPVLVGSGQCVRRTVYAESPFFVGLRVSDSGLKSGTDC